MLTCTRSLEAALYKLDSFPARFGGVHFVNQPWYIYALYTLIKPFLKDKTRKRIFLHGNNLNSLHQLIHPDCLPSEFGGTLPPYDMGTWARTLLGPDYSDENEYTHTSYNAMHVKHASSNVERECSPKLMKSFAAASCQFLCMTERKKGKSGLQTPSPLQQGVTSANLLVT
uniref:Clavesin-1 n=1 Tax=Sphaerodactylus townsendi TaxID=933632 RepID=A0ACB8FDY4_9SAUR